jgi:hypothetical protein
MYIVDRILYIIIYGHNLDSDKINYLIGLFTFVREYVKIEMLLDNLA